MRDIDHVGSLQLRWVAPRAARLSAALLMLWGCSGKSQLSSSGELGGAGSSGGAGVGTVAPRSFGGGGTTASGGDTSSQPGGGGTLGTLGGASGASGGAQSALSAGSGGETQLGGASHSDPTSNLSQPCRMPAGDWCQELDSGQTVNPYLITLNSQDHVIVAGRWGEGGLVVADYTPSGQNVWVRQIPASDADFAEGLTTDGNDNIFIAGSVDDRVTSLSQPLIAKLTPEGNLVWLRKLGGLFHSAGVAVDGNDNAVLSTGANELLKVSPNGDVLWRLTPKDKTGVGRPSVNAAGNILALTGNGTSTFLTEWSTNGDPISDKQLGSADQSPDNLAFDSNGELLFVRYDRATGRRLLWRFSRATGVLWTTTLGDQLFTADQLVLDAQGNIFIAGMANDFGKSYFDTYLAQYDRNGKLLWGEPLNERGTAAPSSLAVSRDGKLYIAGGAITGAFVMRVSPP